MAQAVHVNGEAQIKITAPGGSLEVLGVSEDGVDIEIEDMVEPVYTDTFGPKVPFDEQGFLQVAHIRARLIFYDEAVLLKLRSLPAGGTDGTMSQAGALLGANSKYHRVLVLSPNAVLPWNFPTARIDGSRKVKVGTKRNAWDISWFAVPYTGTSGVTTAAVLYNRTTA